MPPINKEIQDRIELFAEELAELIRQAALESVQEALGEGASPTAAKPRRKKKTRRKAGKKTTRKTAAKRKDGRQARRTSEELEALSSSIASYVKSNPGQRLEQIAKALELSTAEMKRPVTLLLDAKKLTTKGQKRGTMYFARGAAGTRKKTAKKKAVRKTKTRRKAARRL